VADEQGQPVESGDSAPLVVTPKDTFPPATPQRLVAVPIRDEQATGTGAGHIELSWDINQEPDLQGYWVYRSEQPDTPGQPINTQLLLTPTFRDITAVLGKQYTYRVTAVDRSGNESSFSSPVSAAVPQREH
jgi:fibronectin type 3 domain-containing protein